MVSVHAPTIDHVFKAYDDGWDGFHGLKAGDTATGIIHIYFHPGVVFDGHPELEWEYMRYYAHIAREHWWKKRENSNLEGRHDLHLLFFGDWSDVAQFADQPSEERGSIILGTNTAIINHGYESRMSGDIRLTIKDYIKNAVRLLVNRIEMERVDPTPEPSPVPTMTPTPVPVERK